MSNHAAPTTTLATFSSLPTEIKTQIIECCKNADDNYFRRLNHDRDDIAELPILLLKGNKWQGRSLNELLLVNKELSNLCKILLFRVLSSEHFMDSNKFIILKHRHLFRSVTFSDDSTISQLSDLAYFLLNLKNLNSMTIDLAAADQTFGNQSKRSHEELYRFELLRSVGPAISNLYLRSYDLDIYLSILPAFPNLRILQIGNDPIGEMVPGVEGDFAEVPIVSGIQLAELELHSLTFRTDELGPISRQWLELNWSSNLRTLSFQSYIIDDSHIEFINKFSNSLQSLTIKGNNLSSEFGKVSLNSSPRLKNLSIDLAPQCFEIMLPIFYSCHLATFACESYGLIKDHSVFDQVLAPFLQSQSSLQSLVICDEYLKPAKFPKVTAICEARAITLKYQVYEDSEIEATDNAEEHFSYFRPILKEALELGTRKFEQMEREHDAEGIREMFQKCKWLRASAAEMKD